jgi:hypothetical protein
MPVACLSVMLARFLTVATMVFASPQAHACAQPVTSALWRDGVLAVVASRCGRRLAVRHPRRVFAAAVTAAGQGAPNRESLLNQFRCHALFAPFKPEWDLEVARPAVSFLDTVRAGCNP